MFAPRPICEAPGFNRGCLMGVPQLPIPTLLWLDTTQLTPARVLAASAQIFAETRHEEFEPCEQTTSSSGIVCIGRGHVDRDGDAQRIHEDVPFPPFDVFVGIVATDPRRLLDRFHALRIHAGGTWVRMPSLSFAFSPVQRP